MAARKKTNEALLAEARVHLEDLIAKEKEARKRIKEIEKKLEEEKRATCTQLGVKLYELFEKDGREAPTLETINGMYAFCVAGGYLPAVEDPMQDDAPRQDTADNLPTAEDMEAFSEGWSRDAVE